MESFESDLIQAMRRFRKKKLKGELIVRTVNIQGSHKFQVRVKPSYGAYTSCPPHGLGRPSHVPKHTKYFS
jgi:hypothetical protein